jgi:hypothetical protein
MRPDRFDLAFVAAAAITAPVLLALGAGLTFFSDEWALIETRSLGDPGTWFTPHNEHWYTVPILAYRLLVESVGLGSYMPYLALLMATHLCVAALTYALVRRASGPWPAVAVGLVVLLLGSGFENLYWAFQIGFVGSVALGLGAMLAFERYPLTRRRVIVGTAFLTTSVATSGIGLICCVAVGVELLLDPRRRRALTWLVIPAVIYGAWYVAFGRTGIESHQGAFSLARPTDVPPLIWNGFAAAIGAITGVGSTIGGIVLVLGIVWATVWVVHRRSLDIAPRAAGCVIAITTLYGLIALARSYVGPDAVDLTRYTYVSAIFLTVGLSAQIGRVAFDTPNRRRTVVLLGGLLFSLSLLWNVRLLLAGKAIFEDRAERTRALVTVALDRPLPSTTDPERSLVLVPSPASLERIVRAYGSPVNDSLVPSAVPAIRDQVLADARRILAEGAEVPLPSPPAQAP